MPTGQPRNDRQSQAGTPMPIALDIRPGKRTGQMLELVRRNTWPMVSHRELDAAAQSLRRDVDADLPLRIGAVVVCIVDKVGENPNQRRCRAAPGDAGAQAARALKPPIVRAVSKAVQDSFEHLMHVDLRRCVKVNRPGEIDELTHDVVDAFYFFGHGPPRFEIDRRHLDLHAQPGERGSDVMGNTGQGFSTVLLEHTQIVRHAVESAIQFAQFRRPALGQTGGRVTP
jgi:hypothetical protein